MGRRPDWAVARDFSHDGACACLMTVRQSSLTDLFDPVQLGVCRLANRIVMAPLTRCRARADGTPTALRATMLSDVVGRLEQDQYQTAEVLITA